MKILLLFLFLGVTVATPDCTKLPCAPDLAGPDIVFLIDNSRSMGEDNFVAIQNILYSVAADLKNFGSDADKSRVAFITYSQNATTYGGLDAANSLTDVNSTIASLTYGGYDSRDMTSALTAEESIITLRPTAKKLLIAFIASSYTGTEPSYNGLLDKVRAKYDALLAIGVGPRSIQDGYDDIITFTGTPGDAFFVTSKDQLDFARLWIVLNTCKEYHPPVPTTTTTLPVTQPTGLPNGCQLKNLNYDIYLIVDTSNVMTADDFNSLKQYLTDFVREYSVDDQKTQFGLIGVAVDPQRYYTGFHSSQTMNTMVEALKLMTQEPSSGQAFDLALKVVDAAYLSTYANDTKTQLFIYVTANTKFDNNPNNDVSSLRSKYNAKFVTVQYTSNADAGALTQISGGAACNIDATDSTKRANLAFNLETLTCSQAFC